MKKNELLVTLAVSFAAGVFVLLVAALNAGPAVLTVSHHVIVVVR